MALLKIYGSSGESGGSDGHIQDGSGLGYQGQGQCQSGGSAFGSVENLFLRLQQVLLPLNHLVGENSIRTW